MSESVQLSFPGSSSGAFGLVGGIRNFWHMSHISTHPLSPRSISRCLLPPCFFSPPSPWQKRKKKKQLHAWPAEGLNRSETLLSNSHQPCVNPQGDRENSKHRFPAKTKKRTAVRPLSAACLLCKGPTGCQSRRSMPG